MTSDFGVAVHALVFLNRKKVFVNSEQLSKNICTNPARVRKIMAKLKAADLIETREGYDGGYKFSKASTDVTLKEISDSLANRFVSVSRSSNVVDKNCQISSGIGPVMDKLYDELNEMCHEKLNEITLQHIDQQIFK